MKYFDRVKVLRNKKVYNDHNIFAGEIGWINEPEIRANCFDVYFDNNDDEDWYKDCLINVEDLEFVEDGGMTDKQILNDLPKNDPRWWCKVENGYILNLLGEKKNKIPYDYNS